MRQLEQLTYYERRLEQSSALETSEGRQLAHRASAIMRSFTTEPKFEDSADTATYRAVISLQAERVTVRIQELLAKSYDEHLQTI